MTIPTLPFFWSGLSILGRLVGNRNVSGEPEQCGATKRCGYGARCDRNSNRCVCSSYSHKLKQRNVNSTSLFYCLSEGVTECVNQMCGYRTECDKETNLCMCSSSEDFLTKQRGTVLWYCLEKCTLGGNKCPKNTTCIDPSGQGAHRCHCSATATLSPTGQCLGKPSTTVTSSTAPVPTKTTSSSVLRNSSMKDVSASITANTEVTSSSTQNPTEQPGQDSQTLTIGLAAGIGGGLLLIIVVIAVAFVRKRKSKTGNDTGTAACYFGRQSQSPQRSDVPNRSSDNNVAFPMRGPKGTDNPAGSVIIEPTEVSVTTPTSRPGDYEDVDIEVSAVYGTAEATDKRDDSTVNDIEDLYSNATIPANKAQQRKQNNHPGSSDNVPNLYNTLYDLKPDNGNGDSLQPEVTGSGNTDGGSGEYSGTYSTVGTRGGNPQPAGTAPKDHLEYDELKLPRVL